MTADPCPSVSELRGFVLGSVDDDVERRVARHVECCDSCEALLQQFEDRSDVLLEVMCVATGREGFLGEPECEQAVELAGAFF